MKFKIQGKLLKNILNSVYRISYEFSSVELNSFFIETNHEQLLLLANNNVVSIQRKIPISDKLEIVRAGKVIVSSFLLNELAQKTDAEWIFFDLLEATTMVVKTATYKTRINTIDLKFWKSLNTDVSGLEGELTAQQIQLLNNQVAYAAHNKDGSKAIFQGINLRNVNNVLVATATDGSRLARRELCPIQGSINLILPLTIFVETNRILGMEKIAKIQFKFSDKVVLFVVGETTIIRSKLIDGEFPSTDKQFEKTFETTVFCSNAKLISAIDKASVFFEKNDVPSVVLRIENNEFWVSSPEQSGVGFFEEKISEAKIEGNHQNVSLQAKFVLTTLRSFNQENIVIKFSAENGPVCFAMEQDPHLKTLILPIWVY